MTAGGRESGVGDPDVALIPSRWPARSACRGVGDGPAAIAARPERVAPVCELRAHSGLRPWHGD
jgi:hypothetical protein